MKPDCFLTKSAFREAISCPTKLYYHLSQYPKATDGNEYLEFLAEGGYVIGALAQKLYPNGELAPESGDALADFAQTKAKLLAGDVVLFEATLVSGRKLAIADILERKGNVINIIEVKSKSFDGGATSGNIFRNKKGEIDKNWKEYLNDVAFQAQILRECFPELKVVPHLVLVDKSKTVTVNGLPSAFSPVNSEVGRGRPKVVLKSGSIEVEKGTNILTKFDVSSEVAELAPIIAASLEELISSIERGTKIPPQLSTKCRGCEYQGEFVPCGYDECWEGIAKPEHHIFELNNGTKIKEEGESLFDRLIADGKVSLFDIPLEALGDGKQGTRQRTQIEFTKSGQEWIDPMLKNFLADIRYPLHFIDFETIQTAVPYHQGLHPFEQIAFQWSCHTVTARYAEPIHTEWINTKPAFPNFEFAKTLLQTLSPEGTVFTWASHEGTVLTKVLGQMSHHKHEDEILKKSLELLVSSKGSQGRLVDMEKLTKDYYFHPEMKGKTSIKKVFPAIWRSNSALRKIPWFAPYEALEGEVVKDPYKNLVPLMIGGAAIAVEEGTAAMRAYDEMIFGEGSVDPSSKESWKKLLLQYCKLDTLAMVAIWEHWERSRGVV